MKRKEESLSIVHYAGYLTVIVLLLCGMVSLLSSCEKEEFVKGKKGSGAQIPLTIRIEGINERNTESLTRSSGKDDESVTTTIALGDGLMLEMHLAPSPPSQLRATTPLGSDKKYRVIVLDENHQYVSHKDYVGSATEDPDFMVTQGETYDFICVSLNSADSVPTTTNLSVGNTPSFWTAPTNGTDLLYWSETKTIEDEDDAILSITLTHKYSEVTLVADYSYNEGCEITAIAANSIRIAPNFKVKMNYNGSTAKTAVKDSITTEWVSWPSPMTASTSQQSNAQKLFTDNGNLYLRVNVRALTLQAIAEIKSPHRVTWANFPGTTLEGGKSYTLTLKFKTVKFASSNIYWDDINNRLTFEPYSADPSRDYGSAGIIKANAQSYQGVFFKWGSLIGVSPAWQNVYSGLRAVSGPGTDGTPIYVPTYTAASPASSSWEKTNVATFAKVWTETTNRAGSVAWDSIPYAGDSSWDDYSSKRWPYVNNAPSSSAPFTNYNGSEITDLGTSHYADCVGDICRYISETQTFTDASSGTRVYYRLPRCIEFGPAINDWILSYTPIGVSGWTREPTGSEDWPGSSPQLTDHHGTYTLISKGGKFGSTANFFPATGIYIQVGGFAYNAMVRNGLYWSSSVSSQGDARCLNVSWNALHPYYAYFRAAGMPVRCVVQE
ncbi:MAG: hypothetical protein LBS52_04850 [Dysgonamonadaceae bacterium]|jgi:hypothetical protein|nr:hypothetical protein [Dysgonamonadaceae bacterium]